MKHTIIAVDVNNCDRIDLESVEGMSFVDVESLSNVIDVKKENITTYSLSEFVLDANDEQFDIGNMWLTYVLMEN